MPIGHYKEEPLAEAKEAWNLAIAEKRVLEEKVVTTEDKLTQDLKRSHEETVLVKVRLEESEKEEKKWIMEEGFALALDDIRLDPSYRDRLMESDATDAFCDVKPTILEQIYDLADEDDIDETILSDATDAFSDVEPTILDQIYDLADEDDIDELKALLCPRKIVAFGESGSDKDVNNAGGDDGHKT
ncbi:hypothetical protein L1987_80498 [Smallanthus sonchifolius]|uniref:Uncharacterized protein n=1 Tax=Smallanthus sonchifolius TaxID=185202 RepID=A0ACB8YN86_9ASTR|nr:hypothetical protein L1987_80498 [Smallanthus sonchifolius]